MGTDSKIIKKFKDALYNESLRFTDQRLVILEDILKTMHLIMELLFC